MTDDNLEQRALEATFRMAEFYEEDDLADFVDMCKREDINSYEAMLFLDGQTRADYYVEERTPNIGDYIIETVYYFKGGPNNEKKF